MGNSDDTRHRVFNAIDVTEWPVSEEEDLGTKPKRWLIHPDTEERWLMKDATFSEPKVGPRYRKGDDWAERIAFAIAQVLGLPAAEVELAVDSKGDSPVYGTLSRNVLREGESLLTGDELLRDIGLDVSPKNRDDYTVEAVSQALENLDPPFGVARDTSAWAVFIGYLVLDALIGNTDRHEENWGAIGLAEEGSERRLSPTFDHASSLGFMLSDQDRLERLSSKDSNRAPEGYADRAKTPFASKQHPIAILADAERVCGREDRARWLKHVGQVDDLIKPIWDIPKCRMSTAAREFAERVLRHNWSKMTSGID